MKNLPDTAAIGRVNSYQEEIDKHLGSAVALAVKAGTELLKLKEQVPEGEWMGWCRDNICISRSVLNNYMLAANHPDKLIEYQKESGGSARGFLKYIAKPLPAPQVMLPTMDPVVSNLHKAAAADKAKAQATRDKTQSKVDKVFARLPAKDQKTLNEYMEGQCEEIREHFNEKFMERTKDSRDRCRKERTENDRARMALAKARNAVMSPLTRKEFQKVAGMLHPDRYLDAHKPRATEAFNIFNRLKDICTRGEKKTRRAAA